MAVIELLVVGIIVLPLVSWYMYPSATKSAAGTIIAARQLVFGLFGLAVGFGLILSGAPLYMLFGAVIIAYAVLLLLYKQPQKEVGSWLPT
jgi:hypothetical protein